MKISHLSVSNFKGLRNVTIPVSDFVCITGQNNAGKSSVLQAFMCFIDGKKLAKSHYYNPKIDIAISVKLTDISMDDMLLIVNEEHRQRVETKLLDGEITFVRRFSTDGGSRLRWLALESSDPRMQSDVIDSLTKGKKPGPGFAAEVLEVFPELTQVDSKTNASRVKALIQELVNAEPKDNKVVVEMDLMTGIDASVRALFPEPVYIPAVKDFSDDIKTKEGTSFGRLLSILLTAITPHLGSSADAFLKLNEQLNIITGDDGIVSDGRLDPIKLIEATIERYVQEHFPTVGISVIIPPPELKTILSSARIIIDDGIKGELETKGDGLKRSVTFAILRSYAELKRHPEMGSDRKFNAGFLLLFEEPELYLHPSAQRVLFDALRIIAQSDQVIVSTHSPLFFSAEATGTFVKLEKRADIDGKGKPYGHAVPIDLTQLDHKSRFQIIGYETSNSAFFCNQVVLVEGDSDYLVFPHLARVLNPDWCVNKAGIALCRLSGKGSVNTYRTFFKAFDVRVVVLADLDCLVEGFEHFDVSDECRKARGLLLNAVDTVLVDLNSSQLKMQAIKEIATSDTKRDQWKKLQDVYAKGINNEATVEEFKEAGASFFSRQVALTRRIILEDRSNKYIQNVLYGVLTLLRQCDVFLLSRGAIEAYYPDALSKNANKPTRALAFCEMIKTRDEGIALCDRIPVNQNGDLEHEFDIVFAGIFKSSPTRQAQPLSG